MEHKKRIILLSFTLLLIISIMGILVGTDGSITSSAVVGNIACFEDVDCNDRIERTEDICRNPGTEYSLCVNLVK